MGFFTKDSAPTAGGADGLAPLSKERIKAGLEREGWSYSVDSDGDIGGGWEYGSFFFFTNGEENELLCIRGSWRGQLPGTDFLQAVEFCNTWNAEKLWPKTYARRDDEGMVRIHTEHNVDYEQGITDGQLSQQLICAINTGMSFYEQLNEAFPEAWAQAKPAE
ncbi:YbjN domain-containing protein [Leucobacter chromiireducens]|uniref:YbjN domain-containing protein n=1 Tax=Leucobacter chromiireducens subsp. solipictus TaxID=398235 RepID=A0ABS1SAY4_9MICO|nr:YbjN domain-containing protein [Leucobacter chromiireducens]MBL3677700.1 YbjN domain-containing protein [Leucobacter chromiireducens subsp. solipictus]